MLGSCADYNHPPIAYCGESEDQPETGLAREGNSERDRGVYVGLLEEEDNQVGNGNEKDESEIKIAEDDPMVTGLSAHPRHMMLMKPHQVEGFNFLVRNLTGENPGGCILAHATGSGKTFMIISFMQSFLAKYPNARPLVVLPRGILSTWKKEFQTWQVEDIPLYDFYSMKTDSRSSQLEVLKQWVEQRSILFLGYTQFSKIICEDGTSS
ncbi:hypothetical protein RIF29_13645 [Crotalaria pallida]|uniref:SNF2 N-terminal domain-containing protein n=1 Tax=Crotalaria pallida TaxID=3830 RepID=A0AAN9P361_CROPI